MRYIDWIKTEEWTWTRVAEEIGVANATAARRFAHGKFPPAMSWIGLSAVARSGHFE